MVLFSFLYSRKHLLLPALLLVLIAATLASPLSAASKPKPYALLFGTVWGPDQRPAGGVKVYIRRAQDKKPKWTLFSDNNGEVAQRVPAGSQDYVIWVEPKHKKVAKPIETKVHVDNDERVDFGLHLTE